MSSDGEQPEEPASELSLFHRITIHEEHIPSATLEEVHEEHIPPAAPEDVYEEHVPPATPEDVREENVPPATPQDIEEHIPSAPPEDVHAKPEPQTSDRDPLIQMFPSSSANQLLTLQNSELGYGTITAYGKGDIRVRHIYEQPGLTGGGSRERARPDTSLIISYSPAPSPSISNTSGNQSPRENTLFPIGCPYTRRPIMKCIEGWRPVWS